MSQTIKKCLKEAELRTMVAKCRRVINSCETLPQVVVALKWCRLFAKRFPEHAQYLGVWFGKLFLTWRLTKRFGMDRPG